MFLRRKSTEDGYSSSSSTKAKMQLGLLKLSTANAFAKGRLGSRVSVPVDASAPSICLEPYPQASNDSFPDEHNPILDCMSPVASPPRGPYYGMYAEHEEIMELLHTAPVADGSSRALLSSLVPEQLVHVAHLGLGACCSVDLVALHCSDGTRLLAAAKSCYLPPSDPRMRASLKEAELLRRCADCPFIMQLLGMVMEEPGVVELPPMPGGMQFAAAAAAAAPAGHLTADWRYSISDGASSPGLPLSPAGLTHMASYPPPSHVLAYGVDSGGSITSGGGGRGGGGSGADMMPVGGVFGSPVGGGSGMSVGGSAAPGVMSPGYQSWLQWRGGGKGEDLERQARQRLAAAATVAGVVGTGSFTGSRTGGGGSSASGGANGSVSGVGGLLHSPLSWGLESVNHPGLLGEGAVLGLGLSWVGSQGGRRSSLGGWGDSGIELLESASASGVGVGRLPAASWSVGVGGSNAPTEQQGGGGWGPSEAAAAQRPVLRRRASMEVIDMYRDCQGMSGAPAPSENNSNMNINNINNHGGMVMGGGACTTPSQGGGPAEPRVMCRLVLGWARCGDLRRLVQLLLGRSAAHAAGKHSGVAGMPALVPEEAARFYMGCLVLALEHLHVRIHTVHRDLKLANLLLLDSGYAVVGDLGTAVDLSLVPGGRLNARVGSPGHMAPECRDRHESGYDVSADIWSVGACLFALLTGQLPAGTTGPPGRSWVPTVSRHWSRELQDLMGRLLAWSPAQRPSVTQLMRDPWFRGFNWGALRTQTMPAPSCVPWHELTWWPKENRQLL